MNFVWYNTIPEGPVLDKVLTDINVNGLAIIYGNYIDCCRESGDHFLYQLDICPNRL